MTHSFVLNTHKTNQCPTNTTCIQCRRPRISTSFSFQLSHYQFLQDFDMIYLLTAIGLTPGGSSAVHIYTQTIHRTTQLTTLVERFSGIRTQSGKTKINDELTA